MYFGVDGINYMNTNIFTLIAYKDDSGDGDYYNYSSDYQIFLNIDRETLIQKIVEIESQERRRGESEYEFMVLVSCKDQVVKFYLSGINELDYAMDDGNLNSDDLFEFDEMIEKPPFSTIAEEISEKVKILTAYRENKKAELAKVELERKLKARQDYERKEFLRLKSIFE